MPAFFRAMAEDDARLLGITPAMVQHLIGKDAGLTGIIIVSSLRRVVGNHFR